MKRIRAGAIIVKGREVLLLQRIIKGNKYYVFPGGKKEDNENIEETAVRESLEETSLKIKSEKLLYKLIDESNEQFFILCSYIDGEPKLSTDSHEAMQMNENNQYEPMWKNIENLSNLPLFPIEVRDWFIEDYNSNYINTPREQTILIADRRKV